MVLAYKRRVLAYKHRVLAYKHRVEARKSRVCFKASSLYKAATHDLSLLGQSNAGELYYGSSLSVRFNHDSNSGIKHSGVHYYVGPNVTHFHAGNLRFVDTVL